MITTLKQDMLLITKGVLFHQVNCQGVMGAGIARSLANKYPKLEGEYKEFCKKYKEQDLLGKAQMVGIKGELSVVNIFGQHLSSHPGRPTRYDAVVDAFEQILYFGEVERKDTDLYFPFKMGCGLGGGNWEIYLSIIKTYFPNANICVP